MARFLVLAAVALLLAYLLSDGLARLRGRLGELIDVDPPAARSESGSRGGAELVACAVCGVHVPRSRAIIAADPGEASAFYCSEACRGAAPHEAARRS